MNESVFLETLPSATASLVQTLRAAKPTFLSQFYLSGGTALSLQLGHRESEDLDFFNEKKFKLQSVEQELAKIGTLTETELAPGTLNTFLNGVKLQFLEYPYPLINPTINWAGIKLSSIEDVACTKLQTIGMRGSKKDFVDLYVLLEQFSLADLFDLLDEKYAAQDYNKAHILKSLIYFDDAESQPMPRMHINLNWDAVVERMTSVVKSFSI